MYLLADQVQKLRLAETALQKDLQTEAENLSKQVSSSNEELRNHEETHLTKNQNLEKIQTKNEALSVEEQKHREVLKSPWVEEDSTQRLEQVKLEYKAKMHEFVSVEIVQVDPNFTARRD